MLTGMPSGYNAVLTTVQRNMKDVGDLAGHASDTSYIRYLIPVHLFLRQLSFNVTHLQEISELYLKYVLILLDTESQMLMLPTYKRYLNYISSTYSFY